MDLLTLLRAENLVIFLLVAVRSMAAMAVGPLALWPGVSLPIRALIGLGVALVLSPVVPLAAPASQLALGPGVLIQEIGLGLLFGIASTLIVSAFQLAAGLIDFQAGFTFGASVDPIAGHQTGPIEHLLGAIAAVLFFDVNGHQIFLIAFDHLFQAVPVGETPHLVGPAGLTTFFTTIAVAALALALPFVTLLILVDVTMAVLSRAAPQFNLFAVGLPAKGIVALIALILLLPITASQLAYLFDHLPRALPALIQIPAS